MSLNKIIIGFIVILLLFSGYVLYQINRTPVPKSKVTIDNHTFSVEVATTAAQLQQGLSGRASLPKDQGMLFIFKTPARYPFWMKDMKFPLDMLFINNNKIVTIFQNVPVPQQGKTNLPIYAPTAPADQVLEINSGLVKQYSFKKGDAVKVTLSQ
jgi:uncharacterized protein